jgi:hypothetical protein
MAKVWKLDTGTKGTGASVVPLERPAATPVPKKQHDIYVPPKRKPRAAAAPAPRPPRRFRVIDVVTAQTLGEDLDTRAVVAMLADVRGALDVRISVWDDRRDRWRLLTIAEHRTLWDAAHRADPVS